jgi:hypothetical protein
MKKYVFRVACLSILFSVAVLLNAQPVHTKRNTNLSLPPVPVGYDAYLQWKLLPLQRLGVRAYMRSTYDRGSHGTDASHFLFMNDEAYNVTLDVKGKGMLYFFRTNHWHGSPWRFTIDGQEHLVKETATDRPADAKKIFRTTAFIPSMPFPEPLNWTWGTTKGADLIWTPMPFERSLRINYGRTHYGTGYYIYHLYSDDVALSQPLRSWNSEAAPDTTVLGLLKRAGTDIAPQHIPRVTGQVQLNRATVPLAEINAAPAMVRALTLRLPLDKAEMLECVRLQVTWDHAAYPSIDAPLCLFFGAGTLYNREEKEYLVKGLPIHIRYDYAKGTVELACYYPMPFFKHARFSLTGITPSDAVLSYEIRYEPFHGNPRLSSYFHATYRDMPQPAFGEDMTWLDTRGEEGHAEWSGCFAGTSFIFSHNANLGTLEGDPRFFFDDSRSPQGYGTGTEEWGGGGDYWGGENMSLPLAGHPCGAVKKETAKKEKDLIQSAYRFLLADVMPFGRRAVIRFEHSENVSQEHYEAVTYWYGLPAASLVPTDSLDVGNISSEQAHAYTAPGASAVETIRSRYEWGIDTFPAKAWGLDLEKVPAYNALVGKEVYPAHEEDGRYTRGSTAFTLRLRANNAGVLLRRTLDYSFPNQTAEVYVATAGKGKDTVWQKAGTWYLAGSNTCVYSEPRGELDKREYHVQTSNRRFRDDEFLLPARLTRGRSSIRVKIQFVPDEQPLYPGHPFPRQSAWSELRYMAYSYVVPELGE